MKVRNLLLFLVMASFWGINWSIQKIGLSFVSPVTFVLQRFILFAIAFSPVLLFRRKKIPRDKDTIIKLVILTMVNAGNFLSTNVALTVQGAGIGAVLNYTSPLFVFVLVVVFLKEETSMIKFIGITLGFTGIFILFVHGSSSILFQSAMTMIFGAFLWALNTVFYKKFLSHVDAFVTTYFQLALGTLPIGAFALAENDFTMSSDPIYLWILAYEIIVVSFIGSILWFHLIKREGVTVVAGSSLIVPLLALFFGWTLLNESVHIESVIGSALILVGVGIVNIRARERAK